MRLIKRYPNRKLYDTDARQYITLDGVAQLIRGGEDVQVIDYTSGEDLTSQTLSQIILEEEKKQAGFLPQNVLASLVQAGGKTVGGLQRALANSLGWWSQFDEEIKHRLDALVAEGDLSEHEAKGLLDKIGAIGESLKSTTVKSGQQSIEGFLRQRGVPSKDELQQINVQLDALEAKIAALESKPQMEDDANTEELGDDKSGAKSETGNPSRSRKKKSSSSAGIGPAEGSEAAGME